MNAIPRYICLVVNRPKRRQVLECGGWRGTGLTPLFFRLHVIVAKAVCALTPHPPHSKTLHDCRTAFEIREASGLRRVHRRFWVGESN
jgi:hypothetical protein